MRHTSLLLLALAAGSLPILSGCGGHNGVRITEGDQQIGAAQTGTVIPVSSATVVHVNVFERLATLRNARGFADGAFLTTRDNTGKQTATLKARAQREGLRTADILEGLPDINDRAEKVSASESARLSKIYRDPIQE
ncbi:MAG TPA: hypothetical protein DEA90_10525 [Opitutae bacterium]|nr:hypothetical protein [Puniceicoccaceae bacterium]HBR94587.1 hypothetical protein [Opitutae bacterium]|tara:strand:+ start:535 stop:945 length:411 start_codon:yes stop_codon:yes gene_type:complete